MAQPNKLNDQLLDFLDALTQRIQDLGTGSEEASKEIQASSTNALNELKQMVSGFDGLSSMASLAINQVNQLANQIQAQFGQFVDLFDPTAMIRFNLATRDLQASIGEALLPTFDKATALVRGLGDAVAGMGPTAKPMIGALAASAVAMGAMTVATQAFSAVVASATGGLSLLAGGLVGSLVAVGSVSGTLTDFQNTLQPVMNLLSGALDTLGQAFAGVVQQVQPLLGLLTNTLSTHFESMLPVINQFVSQVSGLFTSFVPILEALLPPVLGLSATMAQLQGVFLQLTTAALKPVLAALEPVLQVMGGLVSGLAGVGSVMATVAQLTTSVMMPVFELVSVPMRAFSAILDQIGQTFGPVLTELQAALLDLGSVFTQISQLFTNDVQELVKGLLNFMAPAIDSVVEFATKVRDVIAQIVDWIEDFTGDLRLLFGLEKPTPRNVRDASQGKAVRDVSMGSIDEYIRRAQMAAFNVGGGMDPPKQTARNTGSTVTVLGMMQKWLEVELPKRIDEGATKIANAVLNAPRNAVNNVVNGVANGVAATVISPAVAAAMATKRLWDSKQGW